jgi:magnesium-transporting ATPase (P-type)
MLIQQLPLDAAFATLRSGPAGLTGAEAHLRLHEFGPNRIEHVVYRQATTACLTTIVLMQVVNVHLCRSRRKSIITLPLFENRLITVGVIAELVLILLIDYTPAGNAVFGTAPIGYGVWLSAVPFALVMLMLEESRKAVVRWHDSSDMVPRTRPRVRPSVVI